MWRQTRHYLKSRKLSAEARRWVNSSQDPLKLVCGLMYHLNHVAGNMQRGTLKETIYGAKTFLVQHLYENGYCMAVSTHKQVQECWSCDGSGVYWTGEDCWKCDGTGIYWVTHLYQFVFEVNGRRYVWHQPQQLVKYEVELTESELVPYRPGEKPFPRFITNDLIKLYLLAITHFLKQQGFYVSTEGDSFLFSLREDIANRVGLVQHRVKMRLMGTWVWSKVRLYKQRYARLIRFLDEGYIDIELSDAEAFDDIPF